MADVTINSQNTALLIQDMQNELLKGRMPVMPLSGPQIIANCQKLLEKARQTSMSVIYVRVSRRPDRKDAPRPPFGAPPALLPALGSPRGLRTPR
jgi:nicotinamidase-related amidase